MEEARKSFVAVTQSLLSYRRCLQSSTAGSHEYLKLELPGTGDSPVSSSVARYGATMVSQTGVFDGDQSWNK